MTSERHSVGRKRTIAQRIDRSCPFRAVSRKFRLLVMRKPGLLFLCLILLAMELSASDMHFTLSMDAAALDSFFASGKRVSFTSGIRRGQVGLEVPVSYGFSLSEELGVIDASLFLKLYPIEDVGLYMGTDVISWIHLFGVDSPEEKDIYPPSFAVGYTFTYGMLLVEPELLFQNPLRLEAQSLSFLAERFPSYRDFYFSLKVGLDLSI